MRIHKKELLENFYKHDKLNIALVTDIYLPSIGGVENVVKYLAQALHKREDVNVVVITGDVKKYQDTFDFPVIRIKSSKIPKRIGISYPHPQLDKDFNKLIKKLNLDVIHLHTIYTTATFMTKFARKQNLPVILTGHSAFNQEIPTTVNLPIVTTLLIKRAFNFLNKCDLILPVSDKTKEIYQQNGVTTKMDTLHNATDFSECQNKEKACEYIKEKYNLSENDNILLFVSRLNIKCKNIDFLLDGLKILKDKKINFKLLMIGNGPDVAKIKKMIQKLELTNNVILVGSVADREILKYYYVASDLVVSASVKDTFALIKLEAATQQTPTLAIENTGTSEGIVNNYNGFTSKYDKLEFAKKIEEILSDKTKLKEVSINAYNTLNQTWDQYAENIVNYYKLLAKK